jgi:hypothetical protein
MKRLWAQGWRTHGCGALKVGVAGTAREIKSMMYLAGVTQTIDYG